MITSDSAFGRHLKERVGNAESSSGPLDIDECRGSTLSRFSDYLGGKAAYLTAADDPSGDSCPEIEVRLEDVAFYSSTDGFTEGHWTDGNLRGTEDLEALAEESWHLHPLNNLPPLSDALAGRVTACTAISCS